MEKINIEIITSYDCNKKIKIPKEQEFYRKWIKVNKDLSEYGIEKQIVSAILDDVTYPQELVKLSLCVYWWEKVSSGLKKKLNSIRKINNLKYYFQSDQRCEVVEDLIKQNPDIS